ncbi:hypothetical protein CK203_055516 [Vitis vinifera]|uniref:Retrotransposon gag domain-containing protein n=1 Tax=Vitis vinifera TaxID=29760 RepID=A0A438FKS3_VITVI|nr:hypothetical protein CK203_055516 [Vitis vinifera]
MMFEKMLQLKQGSLSVDQSTDRFHELTAHSKIMETEQQTLARYNTELRNELHKEMWIACLIIVKEVYQIALHIKKQMRPSFGRKMPSMASRQERVTTPSFQKPSFQKPSLLKDQSKSIASGDQKGKAKALNVIIDNGSGMNVISEMAIERLGLKIENPSYFL